VEVASGDPLSSLALAPPSAPGLSDPELPHATTIAAKAHQRTWVRLHRDEHVAL
jgi:hypothetical protein